MKIAFKDHNGTGIQYSLALGAAEHEMVFPHMDADVLLIDADVPFQPYQQLCSMYEKVFVYPHGGGILSMYDGQYPLHDHTKGQFVHGEGQAEILRRCAYPKHVEVSGWSLCTQLPFKAKEPKNILFAPQHPMGNGYLDPRLKKLNLKIYQQLLELPYQVTVRSVFDFDPLNIPVSPQMQYKQGQPDIYNAITDIDATDCVIAGVWTFPCLSIARGIPTIVYGQFSPDDARSATEKHEAKSWKLYRQYCRYPLDASECDDLDQLIQRACTDDHAILDWRRLFIGDEMVPEHFTAQFERATKDW